MLSQTGRLLFPLLGGLLAATLGIRAVYYLGAALLITAAIIGWTALRQRPNTTDTSKTT
jgi:MFS family permease